MSARLFRRIRVAVLVAAALLAAIATFALAQALRYPDAPTRIAVRAATIESFDLRDPSRQRFGAFEFRGGLELTSAHRAFGGISGIVVRSDGQSFLAITDNGAWLRGRIAYRDGRPSGIDDTEIAPLLGADGTPLAARGWFDAESIAADGDRVYVGIERVEQILRFDVGRDGLLARGQPIAVPPDFKTFAFNKSLECLVVVPNGLPLAGALIAVTERSLDKDGNHRSFLLKGADVGRFSVKRSGDYDVSDCAVLPPSGLLLLERRYSPARGVAIRIRRVALAAVKAGALLDGETLMEADMGYQIDNMEGLGIHRNAQGETIVTLISDDNFSPIQRTILLQFALTAP